MKINMPVTDREIDYGCEVILVSKTDLKGAITYVNADFIQVSGFTEAELIGKNHNLVRHPDMPPEAFGDLWKNVKLGKPWVGLVKNRCKNGDYYWVQANVTPVMREGTVVEYMSVRSKPTRQQIEAAEKLYRDIRDKRATLEGGSVDKIKHKWSQVSYSNRLMMASALMVIGLMYQWIAGAEAIGYWAAGTVILASLAAMVAMVFGGLINPLSGIVHHLKEITQGNFHTQIPIAGDHEMARLYQATKSLQVKVGFDVVDANVRAAEGARLRQALDAVSANVMMADDRNNIIYLNRAVVSTLRIAESDIQKDLPVFNVSTLMGASIDIFHKNPSHQQNLLKHLNKTHNAHLQIGGRRMDLVLNPVIAEDGKRLGTVVEWKDRTAELAIEHEIDTLVAAAVAGDMSPRLDEKGKDGFFLKLSQGLNEMVKTCDNFVKEIGQVFEAMSEGDLTTPVRGKYFGDFDRIKQNANTSIEKLTEVVSSITDSAEAVNSAAGEIAQGNLELSQRTESQASALEQTASSMEEITATVKQNAEFTNEANGMAMEARNQAQSGGAVVKQAVSAMSDILTSSHQINNIIGVINEIAFQTNLLALNAAVESARAGEQGRGFAVVASEVRLLAQRSAEAAKEIKDLIKASVSKVESGSQLVNQSGETLTTIMQSVERLAQIIGDVSHGSAEQTSGIEQINIAISQMDEMTQHNAAVVEEASAASEALAEQAASMKQLIGFFRVG
ncbi:MAG: PAS domain S-box protein [Hahellaceae bacterium]|jgi:methyl-accepting chemotaxis protein|nr:PAS domain S-box protein [Hahellaceae bacterium]